MFQFPMEWLHVLLICQALTADSDPSYTSTRLCHTKASIVCPYIDCHVSEIGNRK